MAPDDRPSSDATRPRLERLLGRLATAYLESLAPMERAIALALVRSRAWDLEHLASGRGPLAGVDDRSLGILVAAFAEELLAVVGQPGAWAAEYSAADLDAAMGELKAALG
jgi:hypothetical protein